MKEIFKGLAGIIVIIGLFFVFNTVTQFNAPGLGLLASSVKGFIYVTLAMGVLIIGKSAVELFYKSCFKR